MIGVQKVCVSLATGAHIVAHRGCLIYPTETFFALGGDALEPGVAEQVTRLKERPEGKPFPLVIGDVGMLSLVSDCVSDDILFLAGLFWPGPVSILVSGKKTLPAQVMDNNGLVCVRLSSHPTASGLSLMTGRPLIATSANRSGKPPAAVFEDLDKALLGAVQGALETGPKPHGGLPSTIIRPAGPKSILLIREGAVSQRELQAKGLVVR